MPVGLCIDATHRASSGNNGPFRKKVEQSSRAQREFSGNGDCLIRIDTTSVAGEDPRVRSTGNSSRWGRGKHTAVFLCVLFVSPLKADQKCRQA